MSLIEDNTVLNNISSDEEWEDIDSSEENISDYESEESNESDEEEWEEVNINNVFDEIIVMAEEVIENFNNQNQNNQNIENNQNQNLNNIQTMINQLNRNKVKKNNDEALKKEYVSYFVRNDLDVQNRLKTKEDIIEFLYHLENVLKEINNFDRKYSLSNFFEYKTEIFVEIFIENPESFTEFIKKLIDLKYLKEFNGLIFDGNKLFNIFKNDLNKLNQFIDIINNTNKKLDLDRMENGKLIIPKSRIILKPNNQYYIMIFGLHRLLMNKKVLLCEGILMLDKNKNEFKISNKIQPYLIKRIYSYFGYSSESGLKKDYLLNFLNQNIIFE